MRNATSLSSALEGMLTRYGFTTVVDTGSLLPNTMALRSRIEAGEVSGPRILTAGTPLYPPRGLPYYLRESLPPDLLPLLPQPSSAEEAAGIAAKSIAAGADVLKLFTGSWSERGKVVPMPAEVATAAAAEAHRAGKLVFAHPSNVKGLEVALAAHVDVLAHAVEDTSGLTDALLEPAEIFGETKTRGRLVPGMAADVVVLEGDAMKDVRHLARIRATVRRGAIVYERQEPCDGG